MLSSFDLLFYTRSLAFKFELGIFTLIIVIWSTKYFLQTVVPKGYRYPPGPYNIPIIGTRSLGKSLEKMQVSVASKYGELASLRLGVRKLILISDANAVKEIFDRNASSTSGKAYLPVLHGQVSGGMRINFQGYTDVWKALRSITHKLLSIKASEAFKPSQEYESTQLIYDILTDNEDYARFYTHVRRYSASVILTSTYGIRTPEWNSTLVRRVNQIMDEFSWAALPGRFIADTIPFLAKLPTWLQWWKPEADRYFNNQVNLWTELWNDLLKKREEGRAPECFVKDFMETDYQKQGISELQGAFMAGGLVEAGSETSSSSLNNGIKYLGACPEIQERANEELSRIVGDDRLPSFEDEANLPYIRAMVKEILRHRPALKLGPTHFTTKNVTYKDFFIPEGTLIAAAYYNIHMNNQLHQDPQAFRPDRYLGHDLRAGASANQADGKLRDHFAFGHGRRICPGLHLAENSIFILLAKILWAFKIIPAVDENAKEIAFDTSDLSFQPGLLNVSKPYKAKLVTRNPKREKLLRQEWETTKKEGFMLGNVKVMDNGMVV